MLSSEPTCVSTVRGAARIEGVMTGSLDLATVTHDEADIKKICRKQVTPRTGIRRTLHVRELRSERNWTQGRLARELDVSRQTVNAIETGKYDPSLPLAFRNQQERRWAHKSLIEICGQTLGIIGLGRVGREVAQRAAGFGLRVMAVDANPVDPPEGGFAVVIEIPFERRASPESVPEPPKFAAVAS